MVQDKSKVSPAEAPDERAITALQAKRLSGITGLDARKLVGLRIADVVQKFRWEFEVPSLLFRRICGRVVKRDPITGALDPVPFATVHVEDTDCNLLSFFPAGSPWGWFFPFLCRREVIATVKADRCGRFCAWVPWFDVDWILRWRKIRLCFPDIFVRPSIRDLLPPEPRPWPIPPGPDPFAILERTLETHLGEMGRPLAQKLGALRGALAFGQPVPDFEGLEAQRAFAVELPPPLPFEFRKALTGGAEVADVKVRPDGDEAVRAALALKLGLSTKVLEGLDLRRFIGPFKRCRDLFIPEWTALLDVPDVTFRATQDVNGDGVEENIYSEGYFDVRWNAGAIPAVTLEASSIAIASKACDTPDVPCGNVPAILFAGLMPVDDVAYHDASAGYALRPNRPKPPALPRPAAETPFTGVLQLYGCVNVQSAQFYRVLQSTDEGATFAPMTGLSWPLYPVGGGAPITIAPDASGWYAVLPNPDAFHPARMILEWPTPAKSKSLLRVQIGDAGKNPIGASADVAFQLDGLAPTVVFSKLAWKFAAEADSEFDRADRNLLVPCPTIRRGNPAQAIELQVVCSVAASHLRDASLGAAGCGAGAFSLNLAAPHKTEHWHTDVLDNSETLFARYTLPAGASEGAYTVSCFAASRAFNPAGSDSGHLSDWLYDPVYVYTHPRVGIAIVNG